MEGLDCRVGGLIRDDFENSLCGGARGVRIPIDLWQVDQRVVELVLDRLKAIIEMAAQPLGELLLIAEGQRDALGIGGQILEDLRYLLIAIEKTFDIALCGVSGGLVALRRSSV